MVMARKEDILETEDLRPRLDISTEKVLGIK